MRLFSLILSSLRILTSNVFLSIYLIVCCIYHKPKRFDESSSESDSSDSDASDSDSGRARPGGRLRHIHQTHRSHPHPHHQSGEGSEEGQVMRDSGGSGTVQEFEPNESEPNAYERPPGAGKGKKGKEFDPGER